MRKAVVVVRGIAAVAAGYAVIVLGTILTFEVLLGGIGWGVSSPGELTVATVGAAIVGLLGGVTAAVLAGGRRLAHAFGVLIPLTIDTLFVVTSTTSRDPLWFDLAGSLTLMTSAVLGGLILARRSEAGARSASS